MNKYFLISILLGVLSSCAPLPEASELKAGKPDVDIKISANWECLYQKSVEYIGSHPQNDFPFTWNNDPRNQSAWFRKPLMLIELKGAGKNLTSVKRYQSSTFHAIGRGDALVAFIKTNPCKGG